MTAEGGSGRINGRISGARSGGKTGGCSFLYVSDSSSTGRWLKARRKQLDLTQEALAERVGCSPDTVRKIEAGKQRPSQQLAGLLLTELGVPPDERPDALRLLRS